MADRLPSPIYLRARADALRQVLKNTLDPIFARQVLVWIDDLEARAAELDERCGREESKRAS
jgi:hypothetical protein